MSSEGIRVNASDSDPMGARPALDCDCQTSKVRGVF